MPTDAPLPPDYHIAAGPPQSGGYYLVDPGLLLSKPRLDSDTQVRVIACLIDEIQKRELAPEDLAFEIISCQYVGGPYPSIGMYPKSQSSSGEKSEDADALTYLTFRIEEKLSAILADIGIENLVERSQGKRENWGAVLQRFGYESDTV